MKKIPQILINIPTENPLSTMSAPNIKKAVQEAELLLKNRGRVLLRPSGTESVVRVMVEGNKLSEVQSIANKLAETVKISVK
jgi:phosphoglucosamine mutase